MCFLVVVVPTLPVGFIGRTCSVIVVLAGYLLYPSTLFTMTYILGRLILIS